MKSIVLGTVSVSTGFVLLGLGVVIGVFVEPFFVTGLLFDVPFAFFVWAVSVGHILEDFISCPKIAKGSNADTTANITKAVASSSHRPR